MEPPPNRRLLLVDDNPSIHQDFKKVLEGRPAAASALLDAEAALFGEEPTGGGARAEGFEIDSAFQGEEALEKVRAALEQGRPYAMAFVDVRMPPGWDGIETLRHLWQADPDLQAVICTAFADYSWNEMIAALGETDRLLILKKPFDSIEVCQLASALCGKWDLAQRERRRLEEVKSAEQEARAYAASLETVNLALQTAVATAEEDARSRTDLLLRLTRGLLSPMRTLAAEVARAREVDPSGDGYPSYVESLCAQSARLASALGDAALLSEMDSGSLVLSPAPCSPRALAEEALARARARAPHLALELASSPSVPPSIQSDAARIRGVLDHLLDNAVRFTPKGRVQVSIDLEPPTPFRRPRVRIRVADTGTGIPETRQGRLFEAFTPAPKAEGRAPSWAGAGLGLCVSRRLAVLLGGDLEFESTEGVGSTFTLLLSADLAATRAA